MKLDLTPNVLLTAYCHGIFPMADDEGVIHWLAPEWRAIIELDQFKTTRSLRSVIRKNIFQIKFNQKFEEVMRMCAEREEGTWISDDIIKGYTQLHEKGFAHSVEAWKDDQLAGGLYGVSVGGAFFGESMFHRVTDASKVALVALVNQLQKNHFTLLDIQFMTDHLKRFGATEIMRDDYMEKLEAAIKLPREFVPGAQNPIIRM